MTDKTTKILEMIAFVGIIFSVLYIGVFLYDEAKKEEENYKQIVINIDKDIKPNMTQSEIHNIVIINCQSIMQTESEVYNCIYNFENDR